jgi:protein-S-isoprenylcysteine O-methyltransferase Ste14
MTSISPYDVILIIWFILATATFIALFFVTAPYGRHTRSGWGPSISARWGWIIMESPAPIIFALCFLAGVEGWTAATLLLFGMWQFHYLYRTFIYPFLHRSDAKKMPLVVVGIAFLFGLVNTYLLGSHVFTRANYYGSAWLRDPRFLLGTSLFAVGLLINRQSDRILHDLRDSGETGYQVPRGGLYRWVSSPNYLGEILQWFGWALATWSLAGLAFALWTVANLAPRARSHHQWYRQHFANYPLERRALLPLIW